MEKFHDGHHVWLRSRVHGTYLCADDDGSGVSLHQVRASVHAAWAMHILHLDGGDILMLHNAANGRYLTAPRTGWSWNSVNLCDLNRLPSFTVGWFAVTAESGDDVVLRHSRRLFLRADDGNLLWNSTSVIVDKFDFRRREMRQWVVEAIPPERFHTYPFKSFAHRFELVPHLVCASISSREFPPRTLAFVIVPREVSVPSKEQAGESVSHQRVLRGHYGVQAGSSGRLTPLVTDLPRNTMVMDIVVITAGTNAALGLRHPNVHAA